ncbi:MAG: hypothetical protein AMXMBFR33_12520 [Candidatus Xenobia bacterium]
MLSRALTSLALRLLVAWLVWGPVYGAEPVSNEELGLTLTPPADWVVETSGLEADQAFQLWSPDKSSAAAVFVEPVQGRTQRGIWTGLRYAVVVRLGGCILEDKPFTIAGVAGRRLVFEATNEDGAVERHVRVVAVRDGQELIVHCRCLSAGYAGQASVFLGILSSVRWQPQALEGGEES